MTRDTKGIFISYRREEATAHAGWLADRLSEHFGDDKIFRDLDSIGPGLDFVEAIERAVDSSEVVLAVIGKSWLTAEDTTGRQRLQNPQDYVRREIAAALQRNTRVLPVLIQGASMPSADELPDDLAALARRNAFELHDTSWRDDIRRLTKALENVVMAQGQTAAGPTPIPTERQKVEPERQDGGDLAKVGAIGAALAGAMWLVWLIVYIFISGRLEWGSLAFYLQLVAAIPAWIGTLVALTAIYLYVRPLAGFSRGATVGFVLSFIAAFYQLINAVSLISTLSPITGQGALTDALAVSFSALAPGIGYVLLGIASLRARFSPGWGNVAWLLAGVALIIGGVFALTYPLDAHWGVIGIGPVRRFVYVFMWLAVGYALWFNLPTERTSRTTGFPRI